jgi:hypothetical protein
MAASAARAHVATPRVHLRERDRGPERVPRADITGLTRKYGSNDPWSAVRAQGKHVMSLLDAVYRWRH